MPTLWSEIKFLWKNQFGLDTRPDIPKELTQEDFIQIERAQYRSNTQRIIAFSCFIILLELLNILFVSYTDFHAQYRSEYLFGSWFLLIVMAIYLLLIQIYALRPMEISKRKLLCRSYWAFYMTGVLYICYWDIIEQRAFTNYILLMVVLAIIPLFSKIETFVFIGAGLVAECALWFAAGTIDNGHWTFSLLIAVLGMFISRILHSSFVSVNIAHRQLKRLAETDPLTNLLNRRGFEKKLRHVWPQSVRGESSVMVAVIDIDFFKKFNDKFGHLAGDQCLVKIAQAIALDFKRGTDIVSRFGGEEFIIFAADLSKEKIAEFMRRIVERVENLRIAAGDTTVSPYVTVSIGAISSKLSPRVSFEHLYDWADQELIKAKRSGKNMIYLNGNLVKKVSAPS